MPKTIKPLTNTEVKQAKAKLKEYNLSDGAGLMLRIKPNGSKAWIFNYYQPFTKKRKSMSFGSYPLISLKQARDLRQNAKALLVDDIDPIEQRSKTEQAQKEVLDSTFEVVAIEWLNTRKGQIQTGTFKKIGDTLKLHVFPVLGPVPIANLEAPQVIKALKPLEAQDKLDTLKRVVQHINKVMGFAVNTGLIKANCLANIGSAFQTPKSKPMPSIPPSELPELMQTLARANIEITTRYLIEWQLHTAVRPSEAVKLEWSEVDLEAGIWTIPADKMKQSREHKVPLSIQAKALLEQLKAISGESQYVFSSRIKRSTHMNSETANRALRRMGFEGRLVAHGLRSIASTAMNEQGFDVDVIEAALAHVDRNQVRAAYNRTAYIDRRRELMQWWSDFIEQASVTNVSLAHVRN